jgi:hypothetical protein
LSTSSSSALSTSSSSALSTSSSSALSTSSSSASDCGLDDQEEDEDANSVAASFVVKRGALNHDFNWEHPSASAQNDELARLCSVLSPWKRSATKPYYVWGGLKTAFDQIATNWAYWDATGGALQARFKILEDRLKSKFLNCGKRNEDGGSGSGDFGRMNERERNLHKVVQEKQEYADFFAEQRKAKLEKTGQKVGAGALVRDAASKLASRGVKGRAKRRRGGDDEESGSDCDHDASLAEESPVQSPAEKKFQPFLKQMAKIQTSMEQDSKRYDAEMVAIKERREDARVQNLQQQQKEDASFAKQAEEDERARTRHEEFMKFMVQQSGGQATVVATAVATALSQCMPQILAAMQSPAAPR